MIRSLPSTGPNKPKQVKPRQKVLKFLPIIVSNDWLNGCHYGYVDAEITRMSLIPSSSAILPATNCQTQRHTVGKYETQRKTAVQGVCGHIAGMQIDRENSDTLPSVTLVDLAGSYQINPRSMWA